MRGRETKKRTTGIVAIYIMMDSLMRIVSTNTSKVVINKMKFALRP